ncbi:hypothetical protein [Heyndrickxia ginsengihumi]|uniref:hypothetical protein n=1 Tax=Heyndrickxia ginsengihumi TaxID=363870 RepID=UPI0004729F5A|nr:hypothetical protein [Heyndrickxia ginsengihumi]
MKDKNKPMSQTERNRKWRNSSEEVKKNQRRNSYKRTARTFIRNYATNEDLDDIEKMIEDKEAGNL